VTAFEKHFTAREIAKLWAISPDEVRKLFRDYPGVLKIEKPARRGRRGYRSIRVPESVVLKRHAELNKRTAA